MARPETRIRFLRELVAGEPVTARDVAARLEIGTQYVTQVLENFVAQGYLSRRRPGPVYELIRTPAVFERLYSQRQYRDLRLDLRRQPWVIEATMAPYASLPPELVPIVVEMLRCSHTFFGILRRYRSPDELEEFYAPYLATLRLFAGGDELLCRYHLYHQLYAESIIRDMGSGGLPRDFLEPLEPIRALVRERFEAGHRREREMVAVVRALAGRVKARDAAELLEHCTLVEAALGAGRDARPAYAALLDRVRRS